MGRRSLVCGVILAVALVGVLTWRLWPRDPGQVAPPVSARELRQAERVQHGGTLTPIGGGSKTEAHRLWVYYRDRPAYQGVKPRLLGISRVQVRGTSANDGVFWLVFSDHVYQAYFGPGGGGGYGRQVVLVPDGSRSVNGNMWTF